MFGLGKHGPDGRYGVIVDVGSGSVAIAIVASDPGEALPSVVWSYRERTSIRDLEKIDHAVKDISTALVTAFLTLGSRGFKALREYDPKARVTQVQVLVSAPWSYTIAKTISSKNEHPFEITKQLVEELIRRAEKEALDVIDSNVVMDKLGLEVIGSATIDIKANDYTVHEPYGQEARKVTITHLNGVAQKQITAVIHESQDKVVPEARTDVNTFIFAYYQTLYNLYPDASEVCMIDITAEATELAIVRDGVLKYVTHMPYGTYSLAREISGLCDVPKEEALGYMKEQGVTVAASLSASKQKELQAIITAYEEKLADLFNRTGDALSIPKTIYVHSSVATEAFFKQRITEATSKAHKGDHSIHFITSKIFTEEPTGDTALLLSAYVFHKKLMDTTFD